MLPLASSHLQAADCLARTALYYRFLNDQHAAYPWLAVDFSCDEAALDVPVMLLLLLLFKPVALLIGITDTLWHAMMGCCALGGAHLRYFRKHAAVGAMEALVVWHTSALTAPG